MEYFLDLNIWKFLWMDYVIHFLNMYLDFVFLTYFFISELFFQNEILNFQFYSEISFSK